MPAEHPENLHMCFLLNPKLESLFLYLWIQSCIQLAVEKQMETPQWQFLSLTIIHSCTCIAKK